MTEGEIIEAVKSSFGDLVQSVERSGECVLVIRKTPICALAVPVTPEDADETIEHRIRNARDIFANGLEKLIAAGGDHKKAWT